MFSEDDKIVYVVGAKRETIEVQEKDIVKEIKWNLKNIKEWVHR